MSRPLVNELLVKVPCEEHRDREWVDAEGRHWMWCEDQWCLWSPRPGVVGWSDDADPALHQWKPLAMERPPDERGPYMDALYLRMMGRSW